jgi:hypothetical protein
VERPGSLTPIVADPKLGPSGEPSVEEDGVAAGRNAPPLVEQVVGADGGTIAEVSSAGTT